MGDGEHPRCGGRRARGNIWFSINRSPFLGKLDPKTGKVTSYRSPRRRRRRSTEAAIPVSRNRPGVHPGLHWMQVDQKTGIVWFTRYVVCKSGPARSPNWRHSVGEYRAPRQTSPCRLTDCRSGEHDGRDDQEIRHGDGHENGPAGEGVEPAPRAQRHLWEFHQPRREIFRRRRQQRWSGSTPRPEKSAKCRPSAARFVKGRGDFDPDGNIWVGSQARRARQVRPEGECRFRIYVAPTPYIAFYTARSDDHGEIWAGEMHGGRIARFNPRTSSGLSTCCRHRGARTITRGSTIRPRP